MPKIIIEESITSTIMTGVGKHTKNLNELLINMNNDYEIVSNKFIEKINNSIIKRIIFLIWLNTFFLLKLFFEERGTVVIYTSFLPFFKFKKIIQIGIIHDVLIKKYPETLTFWGRINNIILNKLIIAKSDKIITVSNTVKDEIIKYYNVQDNKIFVAYNTFSLDKKLVSDEIDVLHKFGLKNCSKKYLLSVSSMNKNKNIKMLIEAFDIISSKFPEIKLVLVGGKPKVLDYLNSLSTNKDIIFTGYVSDQELAVLYNNALVYIFPSLYEGFGIPLIDAQLFNLPIICSDIPVFREICQNSVIYAKPTTNDFSVKIAEFLYDINNADKKIELYSSNIQRFSIETILQQLSNIVKI